MVTSGREGCWVPPPRGSLIIYYSTTSNTAIRELDPTYIVVLAEGFEDQSAQYEGRLPEMISQEDRFCSSLSQTQSCAVGRKNSHFRPSPRS